MKIIFLDIDGVLNNREVFNRKKSQGFRVWDEKCVDRLNRITDETGAKIVVSSTWRRSEDLYSAIKNEMGITGEIIGKTIDYIHHSSTEKQRGDEIQEWLSQYVEVIKFVIIDDDSDMAHLMDRLIQTETFIGLTDEHVEEAIKRLS